MDTITYSKETKTIIGLFENLSDSERKVLLEKVQKLIFEQEVESKWDNIMETKAEPMIDMAKNAMTQHKNGKSKKLKL